MDKKGTPHLALQAACRTPTAGPHRSPTQCAASHLPCAASGIAPAHARTRCRRPAAQYSGAQKRCTAIVHNRCAAAVSSKHTHQQLAAVQGACSAPCPALHMRIMFAARSPQCLTLSARLPGAASTALRRLVPSSSWATKARWAGGMCCRMSRKYAASQLRVWVGQR